MQITEMFDGKMCCEEMEQVTGLLERSATTGNYYFSTSKGNMKFCPFCGKEIDKTIKKQIKR